MSRTPTLLLASLGALCLSTGHSTAQCAQAVGNAVLTAPSKLLPGAKLDISLTGARSNMAALVGISGGNTPIMFPFGTICLDLPSLVLVSGVTPVNLSTTLPSTFPAMRKIHLQGFVVDTAAPNGLLALSKAQAVETQPGLSVYSDGGLFDTLGTFNGGGGGIGLKEVTDANVAPEGAKYQEANFSLPQSGGWAGLFIQIGAFNTNTTADMSALATSGFLKFSVRGNNELEIGMRSQNIGPGQERSKILIKKDGFAKLNGSWEEVSIPLSKFKAADGRLDFSQMKVMFGVAVTNGFVSPGQGKFEFDNVRWTN